MRLRRAAREDTAALSALLAASYESNPKAEEAVLRWQYWDNPFGQARSWVAEDGGEIVAHWAAVPVPLRVEGRGAVAAKGVDIATHPAHRRHGLFSKVAGALLDDCAAAGVEVLLTHPNPASAAVVERAGAALAGYARAHVRPLDAGWLARRLHLPRPLARAGVRLAFPAGTAPGDVRVRTVAAPPDGLGSLWARAGGPTGIVRDAAWWRWRYAQRPGGAYRYVAAYRGGALAGAGVVTVQERYGGRFGLVCELLAADGAAARGIGLGLAAAARDGGATGLAAVALPRTGQARLLAAAGLRRLPRRLEPRPLRVMVAAPAGGPDAAASLAVLDWTVAWGDLDHL